MLKKFWKIHSYVHLVKLSRSVKFRKVKIPSSHFWDLFFRNTFSVMDSTSPYDWKIWERQFKYNVVKYIVWKYSEGRISKFPHCDKNMLRQFGHHSKIIIIIFFVKKYQILTGKSSKLAENTTSLPTWKVWQFWGIRLFETQNDLHKFPWAFPLAKCWHIVSEKL